MLPAPLLLSLLLATSASATQSPLAYRPSRSNVAPGPLTFHLKHLHAVSNTSRVIFSDVHSDSPHSLFNHDAPESYTVATNVLKTHRPSSFASHARARLKGFTRRNDNEQWEELSWNEEETVGPDVTQRETLLHLAKMTNNAYAVPDGSNGREWYELGAKWNYTFPFGWDDDEDGFRGHVFATSDNSTVVISIKGTSAGLFGGGGPTARKDKLNDNLLFSCCCASVGFTWSSVCGCHAGGWKCDQNCLEASLVEDSLFYPIGTNLYNNVSYMYPDSTIWLIGHSLGGALASLLGVTFGAPVVTFEAPGERLAAGRLHLPSPPSTHHVTHVYHTADPVPMGTCTGVLSACAIGGYAMESRCHLGKSIIYDTVTKWNWGVDLRTHPIRVIIDKLLAEDWNKTEGSFSGNGISINGSVQDLAVPEPKAETDCVECYTWEFGDFIEPSNW